MLELATKKLITTHKEISLREVTAQSVADDEGHTSLNPVTFGSIHKVVEHAVSTHADEKERTSRMLPVPLTNS